MKVVEKRMAVRKIIFMPEFLRSQQISMAVDYRLEKDRKENRYTHSLEVANACEIMNDLLSEKVGFKTDYLNLAYIVGLLHDQGHTAFSHQGERSLDKVIYEASNGAVRFDGNSNNYVVIQKNDMLDGIEKEDRDYILASLAKHPSKLYDEQEYIRVIIANQTKRELKHLRKVSGGKISQLKKTIQCQIMDIADENCYLVSDIVDSLNIMTKEQLASALRKELDAEAAEMIIAELFRGKKPFIDVMQELFFSFCDNFILNEKGELIPISKEIEAIRNGLARVNKKYVIDSETVTKVRESNQEILDAVFNFFINTNEDPDMIPSNYYQKEFKVASSKKERLIIIRDMLGALTDKGIKNLYKKLQKGGLV